MRQLLIDLERAASERQQLLERIVLRVARNSVHVDAATNERYVSGESTGVIAEPAGGALLLDRREHGDDAVALDLAVEDWPRHRTKRRAKCAVTGRCRAPNT